MSGIVGAQTAIENGRGKGSSAASIVERHSTPGLNGKGASHQASVPKLQQTRSSLVLASRGTQPSKLLLRANRPQTSKAGGRTKPGNEYRVYDVPVNLDPAY